MLGAPYSQPDKSAFDIDWIGVKASQFSFSRLHKADPVSGVDKMCIRDRGSGALKIGQAGEFDYSGSQALKALREGLR